MDFDRAVSMVISLPTEGIGGWWKVAIQGLLQKAEALNLIELQRQEQSVSINFALTIRLF